MLPKAPAQVNRRRCNNLGNSLLAGNITHLEKTINIELLQVS